MRAAVLQTAPRFGKVKENVDDAVMRILALKADLFVLPELFSTGYQFRDSKEALKLAEPFPGGHTAGKLIEAARKANTHMVAGVAERDGLNVYNSSVLVSPGGIRGVYRKAHLFWNEKNIFKPGDTPFRVFDIGLARIGMMICFDWVFPEVARELALKGAQIICHPSNLVLPHCPEAMKTRCLENRVFAITANRVGREERMDGNPLKFIGKSQIVSPFGEVLYRAGVARPASKVVSIDPLSADNKDITPTNNIFRDLRKDLLG
jgi:predicted amidohydrolase